MRHIAHTVLGALALLGLACPAHAFEQTLELRPIGPAPLGSGYASVEKQYRPKVCVQFGPGRSSGIGGGVTNSFYQVLNNSELLDRMDLGVTAGFDLAISGVTVGFDFKMTFAKEVSTNLFKQTVLAAYMDLDAPSFIDGDITLKPEFAGKSPEEIKASCGDFLVVGRQEGKEFYGTAQWEISKATTAIDFDLATALKVAFETGGVEAALTTLSKYKKTDSMDKLDIKIATTEGSAAVQTMGGFLEQYDKFPKTSKKKTVKVIAVPFKDIVTGWQQGSALAFTNETMLQQLVDVAYGHMALIADLDFITVNKSLFALGSTKALSDIRFAILKGAKAKYMADLVQLRKDAKGCDTNFGTKCSAVYEKWKLWSLADQYAAIPERYTSSCEGVTIPGAPQTLTVDGANGWSLLNGADKVIPFPGHSGGDSYMGNHAVKVTASLALTPSSNRKSLDAKLKVKLAEVGHTSNGKPLWLQDTSFEDSISGKVFDLATPASTALLGTERDLNRCKFKSQPFVGKLIKGYAGYIEHTTGKHPAKDVHHIITPSGASGILSSLSCVVAAHLGQSKKIECKAPAFKDTALALINEQDEDADEVTKGAVKKMIASIIKISTSGKAARAAKKKIVVPRGK